MMFFKKQRIVLPNQLKEVVNLISKIIMINTNNIVSLGLKNVWIKFRWLGFCMLAGYTPKHSKELFTSE